MSNPLLNLFISILVVLISLSTSLHSPPFPHPPSLASTATPKALILTAHPDDESMFFGAVTRGLIKQGWEIEALCLSTGNADGQGETRSKELVASYDILGVPADRVKALNHPELQDGMNENWNIDVITNVVTDYLAERHVDTIISFDNLGISSHPNHIAIAHSLPLIVQTNDNIKAYSLKSISTFNKYTGVVGVLGKLLGEGWEALLERLYQLNTEFYSYIYGETSPSKPSSTPTMMDITNTQVFISTPSEFMKILRAMLKHKSQMVWFRWLYVGTSRYLWMAELEEVVVSARS